MQTAMLMLVFTATHAWPTPQPTYATGLIMPETGGTDPPELVISVPETGGTDPPELEITTTNMAEKPDLEDKRWTPTNPLGECMGNCNANDDCFGSLVCWDTGTDREVPVPGCSGTSTENWDYCVDSELAAEAYTPLEFLGKRLDFKLYACQGDCDDDNQCAGRLECCGDWPPQCSGPYEPWDQADFCCDPLFGTGETGSPTTDPTEIPDGYLWIESIAHAQWVDEPLGECQGACQHYTDCEGDLECTDGTYVPQGCKGETKEDYRYCYDPNWTAPDETPQTGGVDPAEPASAKVGRGGYGFAAKRGRGKEDGSGFDAKRGRGKEDGAGFDAKRGRGQEDGSGFPAKRGQGKEDGSGFDAKRGRGGSSRAGALTFSEWLSEGKQFMEIPETVSTTTVLVVSILALLVWVSCRRYCRNKGGSYKKVVFAKEDGSDSEMDVECAQPINA